MFALKGGDFILKNSKNKILIIALAVIGVLLILSSSFLGKNKEKETYFSYELYTKELEHKIESFLKSVHGINNVKVIVSLDTSSELIYAQNQSTYDIITVYGENGKEPVLVTEVYPTVRGIAIACTNGDSDTVKANVTKIICAYLGISSNRIEIVRLG